MTTDNLKLRTTEHAREQLAWIATVTKAEAIRYIAWQELVRGINKDLWFESEEYCDLVIDWTMAQAKAA